MPGLLWMLELLRVPGLLWMPELLGYMQAVQAGFLQSSRRGSQAGFLQSSRRGSRARSWLPESLLFPCHSRWTLIKACDEVFQQGSSRRSAKLSLDAAAVNRYVF